MRLGVAFLFSCLLVPLSAQDWAQWRGPSRDGLSPEQSLLQRWPSEGPPQEWSIEGLGSGYGAPAVAGDRIYVQGTLGRQSAVFCLSLRDGAIIWTQFLGRSLSHNRGGGPRSTPTVDGERLWALSEAGDLASLSLTDGAVLWNRNILTDFGGRNPTWLLSESPLLSDGRIIVTPGGTGAGVVALDSATGATVWKSVDVSDPAGYSSAVVADIDGLATIIAFTARAAVGLRNSDGRFLWRYAGAANRTANVTTPVVLSDGVFLTSAYGTGCARLALDRQGDSVSAEEVYFSREMQNHHGGVVLVDGKIYGFSNSVLTCLDVANGDRLWRHRSIGKGSLTYADGRLYLLSENHRVALVEASPAGYREFGRFSIPDQGRPSWAHPVVSRGRLLIRDQGTLRVFDIRDP